MEKRGSIHICRLEGEKDANKKETSGGWREAVGGGGEEEDDIFSSNRKRDYLKRVHIKGKSKIRYKPEGNEEGKWE